LSGRKRACELPEKTPSSQPCAGVFSAHLSGGVLYFVVWCVQ